MQPEWHRLNKLFKYETVEPTFQSTIGSFRWKFSTFKEKMTENYTSADSIYDFTVKDLHDNDFKLTKYDNSQVLLIVNFATNDELADRNFLELKDLKSKFCDGKKRLKDKIRRNLRQKFSQTFRFYSFLAVNSEIRWWSGKIRKFFAGANLKASSLLKFSLWWMQNLKQSSGFSIINLTFLPYLRLMSTAQALIQSINIWRKRSRRRLSGTLLNFLLTNVDEPLRGSIIKPRSKTSKTLWKLCCRPLTSHVWEALGIKSNMRNKTKIADQQLELSENP